ncbi:hypothetical protein [Paenibacillus sp. LHD-38]|uniref:hypothetical protein n=1 Tax=Paenibacillus sp. LHD-38 TaxID=3072143 RepID=UPI00280F4079|nr:hypothetical protein [Paenibacillus sp. LHD-38]MDQ8735178.1 hypothetical protein [Paenibacillus sp. LHD-38]
MENKEIYLSGNELETFKNYQESHDKLFKDRVIQRFFENKSHVKLLVGCMNGDAACMQQLEETFRKYFFEYRFTKYLAGTIRFYTIELLRNQQKYKQRNQLIFDSPASDKGEATMGELMLSNLTDQPFSLSYTSDPCQMEASFTNDDLTAVFEALSGKQRFVAALAYGLRYQDNEIAKILKVSPQAISKSRNKTLEIIRCSLAGKGVK